MLTPRDSLELQNTQAQSEEIKKIFNARENQKRI